MIRLFYDKILFKIQNWACGQILIQRIMCIAIYGVSNVFENSVYALKIGVLDSSTIEPATSRHGTQ